MPDEPTSWELQRALEQMRADMRSGFEGINTRLDKLVTQDAFQAEQRRVDERFREIKDDLVEERGARERAELESKASQRNIGLWVRWIAASILIPVALFVATLIQGAQAS